MCIQIFCPFFKKEDWFCLIFSSIHFSYIFDISPLLDTWLANIFSNLACWLFILLLVSFVVQKVKVKVKSLSRVRLFATPWTVAYQAPPSMGFSRQECWSGLLFPSPGDLPDPGIEPRSPALQADTLLSEPPGKPPPWNRWSAGSSCIVQGTQVGALRWLRGLGWGVGGVDLWQIQSVSPIRKLS